MDSNAPSTGDPRIDALVRDAWPELIDITQQVLTDRLPDADPHTLAQCAAVIPTELWRPMATLIVAGIKEGFNAEEAE